MQRPRNIIDTLISHALKYQQDPEFRKQIHQDVIKGVEEITGYMSSPSVSSSQDGTHHETEQAAAGPSPSSQRHLRCIVTDTWRLNTPEERVRQELLAKLIREYGYARQDIAVEFPLDVARGVRDIRADIAIFHEGYAHQQRNVYILAEVKRHDLAEGKYTEAFQQLERYVACSPNCQYGLLVGKRLEVFQSTNMNGMRRLCPVAGLPTRQKPSSSEGSESHV